MRDAWVASSRDEAERVYGPEVMTAYHYYWQAGLPEFRSIESESQLTLDRIAPDRLSLGDPEECLSEFRRWGEATGAELCLLPLRHAHSGGPPHRDIMRCDKPLRRQGYPLHLIVSASRNYWGVGEERGTFCVALTHQRAYTVQHRYTG